MSKTLAVVIATIRPESFTRWLEAWKDELLNTQVYVIEDGGRDNLRELCAQHPSLHYYSWKEIDRELGNKHWMIPRRTSAIKSFGFLKAVQDGHDYVWTLDDDCFPEDRAYRFMNYPGEMMQRVNAVYPADSWYNTMPLLKDGVTRLYPRGYPYGIRQDTQPVMIHHGMWSGVPDLDGITALEHHRLRLGPADDFERVPTGQFFAMCGMNLVFGAAMAPAMHFGLQGHIQGKHEPGRLTAAPYDRFDDIWAGLFAKKICDHLGYAVTTGAPSIIHTKESDPTMRVIKEGPGIAAHEILWKAVRDYPLPAHADTVKSSYVQLACLVDSASNELPNPDYWKKLAEAMQLWTEQF